SGEMQRGPEDAVQQQVAAVDVRLLPADREMAVQPEAVGGGGGHASVVALRATAGDKDVATLCLCFTAQVLELAHLVPAQRETRQVVSLDEDAGAAEPVGEPVHRLQRRGPPRAPGPPHP